jgi:hypothetical protein
MPLAEAVESSDPLVNEAVESSDPLVNEAVWNRATLW